MKINIFLFLTFLCAICKAQTVADEVINIDVKVAGLLHVDKMSDIIKDIRYVPINDSVPLYDLSPFAAIQNPEEAFHNRGENLSIAHNRILTNTDGIFVVFDFSGSLLFCLNHKGRGPNEYMRINAMTYDSDSDKYYLACDRKIIELDGLGHVLRSIPYPKDGLYYSSLNGIHVCGDYCALTGVGNMGRITRDFVLIDKKGKRINRFSVDRAELNWNYPPRSLDLIELNNKIAYANNCNDTIFELLGKELKPFVKFNIPEDNIHYSTLLETDSHFAFTLVRNEKLTEMSTNSFDSFCIHPKESNKVYEISRDETVKDAFVLDKKGPLLAAWFAQNNQLIVVLSAQKFLNNIKYAEDDGIKSLFYEKAKAVAQNITENSNPIIVFIELKDKI